MPELWDVAVVGGGVAGLSAATALARARRSTVVVDAGQPRNAAAGQVHGFLGSDGAPPADLLAAGRREARRYDADLVTGSVVAARPLSDPAGCPRFALTLADGQVIRTRRLLIAVGVVDELPPVAGLQDRWGRDVVHCPYCHGWELRDQPLGVLATNGNAVAEALLFRQWSADVVLFTHTGPALGEDDQQQLDARGIQTVDGPVEGLQITADQLAGVRLASGQTVPRRVLTVMPQSTVRAPWLSGLGLQPTEQTVGGRFGGTYLATADDLRTTAPGVWAAGNVAELSCQVVGAAAAGLTAAIAINADLVAEDISAARSEQGPL